MIKVAGNCSSIQLDISDLFNSDIKTITIDGQYNCCPNEYQSQFDFVYPEEPCSYKVTHFVDLQAEDPRTVLLSFIIKVNNEPENILEAEIDSTDSTAITDAINAWLEDHGYDSTVTVVISPETESGYLIDITFSDLPNGVVPQSIVLTGDDRTCADLSEFECVNNSDCLSYLTEFTLTENTYVLQSLMYQNEEGDFITVTFTDTEFDYDPNIPVVPSTAISNTLAQFEVFPIAINLANHVLSITASDFDEGVRPVFFNITEGGVQQSLVFNCSGFLTPISCNYAVSIETSDLAAISTILARLNDNSVATPLTIQSYTLEELDDFITELTQYMTDNGFGDLEVTYEYTDGLEEESLLTLNFLGLLNTIDLDAIVFSDLESNLKTFDIDCVEFSGVPDPEQYDPEEITFSRNLIVLHPEFFGQSEELKDGIYFVKLAIDYLNDDRLVEQYCTFVDCTTKCKLIEKVLENSDLYRYYESLKFGEECENCDCESLCDIFEQLLKELNDGQDEDICRCKSC